MQIDFNSSIPDEREKEFETNILKKFNLSSIESCKSGASGQNFEQGFAAKGLEDKELSDGSGIN